MIPKHEMNELSKTIHDNNKAVGWWDNPNECLYQKLQLVSTEIAEATEGARKNLMDDHLPHRQMEEVELADAAIRLLDLAGYLKIIYNPMYAVKHYKMTEDYSVGSQHLALNLFVIEMSLALEANDYDKLEKEYTNALFNIQIVAALRNYDILSAIKEKVEYNKQRADHKRENRAEKGGKSF